MGSTPLPTSLPFSVTPAQHLVLAADSLELCGLRACSAQLQEITLALHSQDTLHSLGTICGTSHCRLDCKIALPFLLAWQSSLFLARLDGRNDTITRRVLSILHSATAHDIKRGALPKGSPHPCMPHPGHSRRMGGAWTRYSAPTLPRQSSGGTGAEAPGSRSALPGCRSEPGRRTSGCQTALSGCCWRSCYSGHPLPVWGPPGPEAAAEQWLSQWPRM